jgi:hypothetical protein
VQRSDGTAKILVKDTNATIARRTLFELQNNGGADFRLRNTNTGNNWFFSMDTSDNFLVSLSGTGGSELMIQPDGSVQMGPGADTAFYLWPNGDLDIAGTLDENSDRNTKERVTPVDAQDILNRVAELPISEWNRKGDKESARHLGPMAQDFHEAFGLGKDERHLATMDTSGVALAAIQGLYQIVQQKDAEIEDLKAKLAQIEQVLATK